MAGGSASKNKGNSGERELCKFLGEMFSGSFVRVPNSGAAIGGKNFYKKSILSENQVRSSKGDIVPPDHMSKLVLECKNYGEFRFHQLMMEGTCPQLDEWIKQTIDILDAGDVWFVIFKISRIGWFVAIPEGNSKSYVVNNHCSYTGKHGKFIITDMKKFFETNRDVILEQTA